MRHALRPQHVFTDSVQRRGESETQTGAHFGFVSFFSSSLRSFIRNSGERTQNKKPAQDLLTMMQIVENDNPVPSHLADVFREPEGWIETPPVAAEGQDYYAANWSGGGGDGIIGDPVVAATDLDSTANTCSQP